jgi:arylsulfatase A-like enzyme
MSGGKAARWVDEDMADTITQKAVSFIDSNKSKPFFLYFATHDIHVPRVPNQRFVDKSQCGIRCDAIQEFDWSVGEVMKALEKNGLTKDTMIVVTSDNGPVVDDGYADGSVEKLNGHTPAGALQGGKYSPYEGGTRVPFLVRWPARVKAGKSDALVSQIDLMASLAAMTGQTLAADAAPDSMDVSSALLGDSAKGRETLIQQASRIAIRSGRWKLIAANGPKQKSELFDLTADLAEAKDLAASNPAKVTELQGMLEAARNSGRTRK